MKGYGFLPAFPSASAPPAPLPRREVWRRYRQDRRQSGAVACGRCEATTLLPATEGWGYRKFSSPLFTETRCKLCLKITGVGPADETGGTKVNDEEPA